LGFEPTIPASERAKTFHALDRAATVIGGIDEIRPINLFANISKRLININNLDEGQNICHQMLPSYTENLLELILSDKMTRVKQNQDIRSGELIQRPDNTRVTQRQPVLQHSSVGY
jgi:hypothetical protein